VSEKHDSLHLLERTNISLELQNSIVPTAYTLARFKVSADLPTLQVNMSDEKYKSLIRLIEVSIPIFDGGDSHDTPALPVVTQIPYTARTINFPLSAGLFAPKETPYTIDDDDGGQGNEQVVEHTEDQFFEVDEGNGSKVGCLPV
jgi:vacuolar protein sorting-associated protein 13A/C